VTGGAKRVGRAITLELASAGCDVAVHYHHSARQADELVLSIMQLGRNACSMCCDLNDSAQWKRLIESAVGHLGGLDILINNASSFEPDRADSTSPPDPSQWEALHRVNALAPVALCEFARSFLEQGAGGVVVNLSDISAEKTWPSYVAYCSSKATLNAATRALARKLAPKIRVNAVAPGIAVFPDAFDKTLRSKLVDRVPLARAGTPEEVAKLVRFLCEEGDYITGQVIAIDGGRSLAP